jgi:hypothetical protein
MRPPALLSEAQAIERDGGYWKAEHVAAVLNVSVASVRRMSIPRAHLDTVRNTDRPLPRFVPSEVRAWVKARSSHREKKTA